MTETSHKWESISVLIDNNTENYDFTRKHCTLHLCIFIYLIIIALDWCSVIKTLHQHYTSITSICMV